MPFDAAKAWGVRGRIKVKGEINGFAFRTSLFPTREGRHILLVNKRMQKGARAAEGSVARFQIEVDREERGVTIPDELKRILSQDRSLRRWYDELNHSTRNEIAKWITEPRASQPACAARNKWPSACSPLWRRNGNCPPFCKWLLRAIPSRAREGWDLMSASRRRGHLFGIFYYRTPDAQARRIDKMLDDAATLAEKISNKKK